MAKIAKVKTIPKSEINFFFANNYKKKFVEKKPLKNLPNVPHEFLQDEHT